VVIFGLPFSLGGFTDAAFNVMKVLEAGRDAGWPFSGARTPSSTVSGVRAAALAAARPADVDAAPHTLSAAVTVRPHPDTYGATAAASAPHRQDGMNQMRETDQLDRVLHDADPARAIGATDAIETALDDLGGRIVTTPIPTRRRRPRRTAAAVAVIAAMGVAAPAAADWVSARTGWFGNPSHSEEDASEWVRIDSPELGAVVADNVRSLKFTLPSGVSEADVASAVTARLAQSRPARMQEGAIRNMIGWDVACRWGWIWVNSHDPAARSQVADVARRVDAMPAALGSDDSGLAAQIQANCPADTK
jgi:hypothetical protein